MPRRFAPVVLLVFASMSAAQDKQAPRFRVQTSADTHAGCALVEVAPAGRWRVHQAGMPLDFPRVLSLRQEGRALPPLLTRDFVLLSNGDRLALDSDKAAAIEDSNLHIWPASTLGNLHGRRVPLYLPNVVLLFWTLPGGIEDADLFVNALAAESRKRDAVYLRNGDRIEGSVTLLTGMLGCQIVNAENKTIPIPWSKLAGIAFSTERQARLRTKLAYWRASLAGGVRLNLLSVSFAEESRRWMGKTQFGPTLELSEQDVVGLEARQAQAVDLADLTPLRYEHRPYLGVAWPLVKDAAAAGHPLRIAGNTYEKGIGVHAPASVTYKLDGRYVRFDCEVGLDDVHARRGRVRLAVKLDGKRIDLNDGKERTSRDGPLLVHLDVRGVREMTLVAELGSFGDVQAHVNWAAARLIKSD